VRGALAKPASPMRGAELRHLARRADPPAAGQGPERPKVGEAGDGTLRAEAPTPELRRVEFVGPQVGKELAENGAMALLLVIIGIMPTSRCASNGASRCRPSSPTCTTWSSSWASSRFFQWEFSLPVLAAVLAVLGYSVNESVVVFDRVRENFRKMRKA
jgi:preprotein translocase subunit SecF